MKTDKEISEKYIQSAERYLNQSDISSIEWAVVHYKRAVLFDHTNFELRNRFVEVFHQVSTINKTIENEDIQKTSLIKEFIEYLIHNKSETKHLFSNDFSCEYNCYGFTLDALIKNLKNEITKRNKKYKIGYFFIANRFNPCLIIDDTILRFGIKNKKIEHISSQKIDGADISSLLIWVNN
jgi:hypothetical protein